MIAALSFYPLLFSELQLESHLLFSDFASNSRSMQSAHIPMKDAQVKVQMTDRVPRNFTVAICAIVKDAEAYFMEWIDYNLLGLEFDQIYVYDNSENFELQRWFDNTRQHPDYRRVEVMHYTSDKEFVQKKAYDECVNTYGKAGPLHDYIAFIDYDEFIVMQQPRHDSIHDLLEEYLHPFGGALAINWMYMGSANRTIYSPLPVTKRFQYSDENALPTIKTIVKSSDFASVTNPHAANLLKHTSVYDTAWPGSLANVDKGSNSNVPTRIVLVYHYRFMSEKEFLLKQCWRTSLDKHNRGCDNVTNKVDLTGLSEKFHPRAGTIFNDKAWTFLIRKVPKYKIYDLDEWHDNF